jgi:hypothetical protein
MAEDDGLGPPALSRTTTDQEERLPTLSVVYYFAYKFYRSSLSSQASSISSRVPGLRT